MSKNTIISGVGGIAIGVLLMAIVASLGIRNHNAAMLSMMGIENTKTTDHSSMSMDDMAKQLQNKNGDDFDKAFVEMMISHHEGAVDMAELIPARAKHDELKKLGEAIVSAQTKEIADMKQWQKDWGYSDDEMNSMMHGNH